MNKAIISYWFISSWNGIYAEYIKLNRAAEAYQSHTAKQDALETIERLPDNVDLEEIMYRLYVLEEVHKGHDDVTNGRTIKVRWLICHQKRTYIPTITATIITE